MTVTLAQFPGKAEDLQFDQDQVTLSQILERAGLPTEQEDGVDIMVNGQRADDLEAPVPDGSTVTRAKRVRGA